MANDKVAAGGTAQAQPPLLPGATDRQVVVGDIPMEPSCFRARAGLLAELDRASARVSVIHPVTGLHGLGTTQLAAAYARAKLEAGWRLVAWVNSGDIGSLLAGLAAVADATGLAGGDPGRGVTDAGASVRHWLEADGDQCLLVFDDVADPEAVRPYIPVGGAARVLITSNRQPAADLGSTIEVDAFGADEAAAFLAVRAGRDDEAGAAEVAAALGHLPLALALAAPVVAVRQRNGYEWYLDRLQTIPVDVALTGDDGEPYPPSVARTVLLSLHAVRAADRTGICTRVMEIMAGLSPAGVHRELLYSAGKAGVLASGGRLVPADLIDRALEWLGARSLLTLSLDGQTVVMHRLVAQVIRNGLARRGRLTAAYEAAVFVLDVYSRAQVGSPDRRAVRGILQQVTALLESLAEPATEVNEELTWVLLRLRFVALYLALELGDSTQLAIAVGEPLAEDLARLLGPYHPDTLNSRNSLAAAYLAAGRVAAAIPLFEQILDVRQRTLGPGDSETLTSQNNLASAYQDAGRTAEAIRLYERNLEIRERLLGPDHPSTLNSRANLAAAYRDGGRVEEAIPLLEQTLAARERVLGPEDPDTQATRKNLATAYQDTGRAAEAVPLLERALADRRRKLRSDQPGTQTRPENVSQADRAADRVADTIPPPEQPLVARKSQPAHRKSQPADRKSEPVDRKSQPADRKSQPADRKSQPADRAAGPVRPAGFRRPPAAPARRALPAGFRRPPAATARPPLPSGAARPPVKPAGRSSTSRTAEPPRQDGGYDPEIVAAITAEDPAGIAMAYDRYAAALYGYSHWILHDSTAAAGAVKDTFVIAAATAGDLSEPSGLRPWLFALTRNEARRRMRPASEIRDEEADASGEPADAIYELTDADDDLSDATVQFRAIGPLAAAGDETVQFRAVGRPPAAADDLSDATVQFRAVGRPPAAADDLSDATVQFRAVGRPPAAADDLSDATVQFQVIRQLEDPITPFRVIGQPAYPAGHLHGDQGQAELRSLIHSVLAGLRPREREVIELIFRHDLNDSDLAIALGVSQSRADDLASRARSRLEEALGALHIALTGREACPVLGELLAGWDGQLTEQTRELIVWHIGECQTCTLHGWGAMRPAAFSRLLPLAPLPHELREQVLRLCTSTAGDAVAYRRRVVRRAEWIWLARFSRVIRHVSWSSIRAKPGVAVATVAVAMWVVAAVSVTLVTLADSRAAAAQVTRTTGSRAAPAQSIQTGGPTVPGSHAAATASAPASAARPSPAVTQSPVYAPTQAVPSRVAATSPAPSRSASSSARSSKSAKPSGSPSPSSHTASPSPSTSTPPAT
jgi:RNA polymerase sigma factor (sigma-70 family)